MLQVRLTNDCREKTIPMASLASLQQSTEMISQKIGDPEVPFILQTVKGSALLIVTAPGVPDCIRIVCLAPSLPSWLPDKDVSISVAAETGRSWALAVNSFPT